MARDYIASAISQAVGLTTAALSLVLVARWLGPEGRGQYALLTGGAQVLALLGLAGFRTGAIYMGSRGLVGFQTLCRAAEWISLLSGAFVMAAAVVAAAVFPRLVGGASWPACLAAFLTIPQLLAAHALGAVLLSQQRLVRFNVTLIVQQIVWLTGLVVVLSFWPSPAPALFAWMISHTLWVALIRRGLGLPLVPTFAHMPEAQAFKRVLSFGLQSAVGQVVQLLTYRISLFVISLHLDAHAVGIYSIATVVAEALWQVAASVANVNLPKVSATLDSSLLTRGVGISYRLAVTTIFLVAVGVALCAPWLVRWCFGSEYLEVVSPLRLLLPGTAMFSITLLLSSDLVARGYPRLSSAVALVTLVLSTTLYIVLVPRWGLLGAALAGTVAYTLSTVVMMIVHFRTTRIPTTRFLFLSPGDLRLLYTFLVRSIGLHRT